MELERDQLHHYFPELFAKLPACKFHNCLHRSSPSVRSAAVEKGEIAEERYVNYLDLYENPRLIRPTDSSYKREA